MKEAEGESAELADALTLVRSLWERGDVPERAVAWAMMIEAVDRLAALHGPARAARLLERLARDVRGWPVSRVLQ
ncbi:hypothetical protein J2847_006034 [Azospirillum agricola]|uniref:hypothetical protein n=1 Tax=Azospirillum agricola TaxID=1720247 RepID=UPI002D7EC44D|nr:hypothetical protein [Azospirillum agricola]MBP2232700.1 hypothetical protein [Azospirillum agricola]